MEEKLEKMEWNRILFGKWAKTSLRLHCVQKMYVHARRTKLCLEIEGKPRARGFCKKLLGLRNLKIIQFLRLRKCSAAFFKSLFFVVVHLFKRKN